MRSLNRANKNTLNEGRTIVVKVTIANTTREEFKSGTETILYQERPQRERNKIHSEVSGRTLYLLAGSLRVCKDSTYVVAS